MNGRTVLITGHAGLVGRALRARLEAHGAVVRGLDVCGEQGARGDVRDVASVERAVDGVEGIVHLAAVSRVVWGERDPRHCWAVNAGGLSTVLCAAAASRRRPWVLFVSSREVYGASARLPVREDAPLQPLNHYARTKGHGESLVRRVAEAGLCAATVRLSNVYGDTADHLDRVVPAFARAAALGGVARVDGPHCMFDFTHIDDVASGLMRAAERLAHGDPPPTLHLTTGAGTTLADLAAHAAWHGKGRVRLVAWPARSFDVPRFVGDPALAHAELGWRARVGFADGFARLTEAFRASHTTTDATSAAAE